MHVEGDRKVLTGTSHIVYCHRSTHKTAIKVPARREELCGKFHWELTAGGERTSPVRDEVSMLRTRPVSAEALLVICSDSTGGSGENAHCHSKAFKAESTSCAQGTRPSLQSGCVMPRELA